jgi:hypothetical protein
MKIVGIVIVLLFASGIQAQGSREQTPEHQHADMMKRGDTGMGFSQEKTTHHFRLTKDGGVIEVGVNDPNDEDTRDHIRMHLSRVAQMFAAGEFDVPTFIHDTTPPGVAVMKKLQREIHYHYLETSSGGKVTIETANPKAVDAVHEFLRFQIAEHKTGDSIEVKN